MTGPRCWIASFLIAGGLPVAGNTAAAEQVSPGVTYDLYNAPGPNRVHVVAVERQRGEYKLEVGWSQRKRNYTAKARTSEIAALYDSPPGHDVLAAVNGAFFDGVNLPAIIGTAASRGEIMEPPDVNDTQTDTFFFGPSRRPAIRSDVGHVSGTLTFANGTSIPLDKYNVKPPPVNKVTAYTPNWDASTGSSFVNPTLAVEVILEDVSYPMRGDKEVSGIVSAIRLNADSQNNPIPAGGMVLTAWGGPKTTIVANTQVGDRLRMRFDTNADEYNNADMAITGIGWVTHDGLPNTANWAVRSAAAPNSRNPRTVLAWSDTHLFLVVCDGRSAASVGMTFSEMSSFLTGTLGVVDAVNLDGGGSSTMVVNGGVRNTPSDGGERLIANAVMLVREDTATVFPFSDPFSLTGREPGWDDKYWYNAVTPFVPVAPGGDGYVLNVTSPTGFFETTRRGDFNDTDYSVQAEIYCEYRPDVAGDGFERYVLFSRDDGTGALELSEGDGGNCYALTYDSDTGRIRAGKYVGGVLMDFRESEPVVMASTAWRRFRIDGSGSNISYWVDDVEIAAVQDTSYARGYYGIGYYETFATDTNIRGTRAENFAAIQLGSPPPPASNPDPAHGAMHVSLAPTLSWTPGFGAASRDVYFGTESPGTLQGNQVETTFDPGPLDIARTYYWRVDEINENGATIGPVWSFTTQHYRGDFDDDRDIDQEDFGRFQACYTGTAVPQYDPACARAKLDGDNDVDLADFDLFMPCQTAPNVTADPSCLTTPP